MFILRQGFLQHSARVHAARFGQGEEGVKSIADLSAEIIGGPEGLATVPCALQYCLGDLPDLRRQVEGMDNRTVEQPVFAGKRGDAVLPVHC